MCVYSYVHLCVCQYVHMCGFGACACVHVYERVLLCLNSLTRAQNIGTSRCACLCACVLRVLVFVCCACIHVCVLVCLCVYVCVLVRLCACVLTRAVHYSAKRIAPRVRMKHRHHQQHHVIVRDTIAVGKRGCVTQQHSASVRVQYTLWMT